MYGQGIGRNDFTRILRSEAVSEGFSSRYSSVVSATDASGLCSIEMVGVAAFGL